MKRNYLMTVIFTAIAALMMTAVVQDVFAADSGITITFEPKGAYDPEMLNSLIDENWPWSPRFNQGDVLSVTENGIETKYIYDSADYKGYSEVLGFYDEDGNALGERFRCEESGYSDISSCVPYFEWDGALPSLSGQNAAFRLTLYEKNSPEGSEPVAKSNPIEIYIEPCCVIGGIEYKVDKNGTAFVNRSEEYLSEYTIEETVRMDDGKVYPVKHIGVSNVDASILADGGIFIDSTDLESITIPESVTTIKSYSFFNTPLMKEVTIPPTVEKIGTYALGYTGDLDFFGDGLKNVEKVPGFVIYAKAGSEGARYAKENGFRCVDLEAKVRDDAADKAYSDAKKAAAAEKAKNTPAKVKRIKLKKGKNKLKVKWKKISKATGYKVRYSTDKNFKKGVKTVTIRKYRKKGLTIRKLKKNKRWYVQIRAYKKVRGKTYYGAWSPKKSAKVR